jgi:type IV secretory pathway VirB6-like protein
MNLKTLKKHFCFFLCYFYALSVVMTPLEAYAIYDDARDNIGYNSNGCDTGTIKADPFTSNRDMTWELSNPICITYIAAVGVLMASLGIAAGKVACIAKNPIGSPRAAAELVSDGLPDTPILTPETARKLGFRGIRCASRLAELASLSSAQAAACAGPQAAVACAPAGALTALATTDATTCCASVAASATSIGVSVAALMIIYAAAKISYDNAKICGSGWNKWVQTDGKWTKTKGDHAICLESAFAGKNTCNYNADAKITNQNYREYIYGGFEYKDTDSSCKNPWSSDDRINYLGYDDDAQRYYMTGPAAAPAYACQRFLSKTRDADSLKAFECCKNRSQETICIESSDGVAINEHKFCTIGSKCHVGAVWFEAYESKKQPNYACAKTYSVCPYNHQLGGGTEVKKYKASDTSQVENFCQFMNHCSKLPLMPYVRTSNLEGEFISGACRNLIGDSQNVYGYESGLIPLRTKGFSAPMAQCFKETMENVLLNTAGDTKCINPDESPSINGTCESGYIYKKGVELTTKSFFVNVQDGLQSAIKMVLTLSITFFGIMILFAVPGAAIERKKLLPYILKIGLVMYFAVGDGWQAGFMRGVLGTSTFISEMVFSVDVGTSEDTRDGCQFPRYNYSDTGETTRYTNPKYPPGKEYLAIWDTLDCKIARAMGFGPEVSVPNLLIMIVAGFFTGGLGILFVVGAFLFAFFLISITVRALHIFLISVTAIVIMIYVSPITITLSMFERTKSIFDGWWKNLLGFILQPMILFAYLGILITLFDKVIIGEDVRFSGDGKSAMKKIICTDDAQDTSMYCIFRVSDIKTYHGLEVIGIGIPMLGSMNAEKLNSILRAAILMFIFANFMDKITTFAKALVGGAELKSNWNISTAQMASKAYSGARNVQKRAMGAIKKHGSTAVRAAGSQISSTARDATNRGKSADAVHSTGGSSSVDNGSSSSSIGGDEPKSSTGGDSKPSSTDK